MSKEKIDPGQQSPGQSQDADAVGKGQLREKAMGLATMLLVSRQRALGGELPSELAEMAREMEEGGFSVPADALRMRHLLQGETDRGCALVAAAYLDEELEKLLRAFFIDDKKIADALLNNESALGSFSSRIKIGLALGLLSRDIYRELELVRKIRNEFAHVSHVLMFNSSPVRDWCFNLTYLSDRPRSDARGRFTGNVMRIAASIHVSIRRISEGLLGRRTEPEPCPPLSSEDEQLFEETQRALAAILEIDTSTPASSGEAGSTTQPDAKNPDGGGD